LVNFVSKVQKEATGNVLHYKQLQLPDSDVFAVEVTAILSSTEMVIHPCKVKGSEVMGICSCLQTVN